MITILFSFPYTLFIHSNKLFCDFVTFKGALSDLRQLLATKSPLKMMKKALYFTLKALFVLKIFKFCLDILVIYKSGLIRKVRLISKFMTSQAGQQTVAIHIPPNISRRKGNQTMKFGPFKEYNRNIFLQKSYTKCGGKTIPRPLGISLEQ